MRFALVSLLFLAVTAKADFPKPSLIDDCHFTRFLRDRMPNEREKFWIRTKIHEEHFLGAENEYDSELSSQAVRCFEKSIESDFKSCDLTKIPSDEKRFEYVSSEFKEYDYWNFARYSLPYAKPISNIRATFFKESGKWLKSCFNKESLSVLDHVEVVNLYHALRGLQASSTLPELLPVYLNPHAIQMTVYTHHFGSRTNIHLELNGLALDSSYGTEDDDYELKVQTMESGKSK